MSENEIEIEKPNKIVDNIEKILEFKNQNQKPKNEIRQSLYSLYCNQSSLQYSHKVHIKWKLFL